MAETSSLYALLIAGGQGTRLWPWSRTSTPKQLLDLRLSGKSLIQEAFLRLSRSVEARQIYVVTVADTSAQVLAQLREVAPVVEAQQVLAEPQGRDSAAAVLWGLLHLQQRSGAAAVVAWADLHIGREAAFDAALERISARARAGGLALVGARPQSAAEGLGYIRYAPQPDALGLHPVLDYVEKPPQARAAEFIAQGGWAWNIGLFCFCVEEMLAAYRQHAPALLERLQGVPRTAAGGWDEAALAQAYAQAERISLDYLVLEKCARQLSLYPADLDWSDLGLWSELRQRRPQDAHGNAVQGPAVLLNTRNCLIQGEQRLIAAVGVENLAIVDTPHALLVLDLRRSQDVKALVEQLQQQGCAKALAGEETRRPWGTYSVLLDAPACKVKELVVQPGQRMSLQLHRHRAEHWVVVQGEARLTLGDTTRDYAAGEYVFVPQHTKHRIANAGAALLKIVEVQTGDYLEEDDIIRFADDYQRS